MEATTNKCIIKLDLLRQRDKYREFDWLFEAPGLQGASDAVHVYLSYSAGGRNYANGNLVRPGYYVSVRPVEVTDYGESYEVFDDRARKYMVAEASRFNRRKLEGLRDIAMTLVAGYVHQISGYKDA